MRQFPIAVVAFGDWVRRGRSWHEAADMLTERFPRISRESAVDLIFALSAMTPAELIELNAVLHPHKLISFLEDE
jgi:hypothetical protein